MRVGVCLPTYGAFPGGRPFPALAEMAQVADEGGCWALWVPDHLVLPAEDIRANGGQPGRDEPLEAWTLLASLATCTRRVRLGTEVTPLPLRHPVLLAKVVAAVDHASEGRVILGAGAGWFRREFRAAGIPYEPYQRRIVQTREAAQLLRLLFGGLPVSFEGEHYRTDGAFIAPAPLQAGGPPLWFGGRSDNILRLAAELGDGWITATNAAPEEVANSWERLRGYARQVERDPGEIAVAVPLVARVAATREEAAQDIEAYIARGRFTGYVKAFLEDSTRRYGVWGDPEDCLRRLEPYRALGVRHFILDLRPPDHALDSVTRICERLLPALAGAA